MKRYFSGSESDDENRRSSSSGDPQMAARKKRRGVIEKRRRDRINNSLSELRRLVPTASEKQGCAKLEKAEILQLTVEHLKGLHGSLYMPTVFDLRSAGYRECAAEVARYLTSVEGMEPHEPLALRLLTHLHNALARREREDANTLWNCLPTLSPLLHPTAQLPSLGQHSNCPNFTGITTRRTRQDFALPSCIRSRLPSNILSLSRFSPADFGFSDATREIVIQKSSREFSLHTRDSM